jgi:DNA polymerase-4
MILHVDMDAFFASVEQLDHPEWKGKCLLVGGRSGRGVVAAASYEARKFGVHSAMPMFEALRRCPQAVVVPPRRKRYAAVSRAVMDILGTFSPLVECVSIDEAYLDVSGCERLHGTPERTAAAIKAKVYRTIGLTCSVGAAPVKFLAKIASDLHKPDGLTVIRPEAVETFLENMPVEKIPGIGGKTLPVLHEMGIRTMGDVRKIPEKLLVARLGKYGQRLKELAEGRDDSPVVTETAAKSHSSEETLAENTRDRSFLRQRLLVHAEEVARQLRRHGLRARVVVLKIKHADFRLRTRSITLPFAVQSAEAVYREAERLLDAYPLDSPVRLVGVGAAGLQSGDTPRQQNLFGETASEDRSWEAVEKTMDRIAARFGSHSICRASLRGRSKHGEKVQS